MNTYRFTWAQMTGIPWHITASNDLDAYRKLKQLRPGQLPEGWKLVRVS